MWGGVASPSGGDVLCVWVFQGALQLMDFNPFCPMTDPLLFTWEELIVLGEQLPTFTPISSCPPPPPHTHTHTHPHISSLDTQTPLIRVVESAGVVQPTDLYHCRLPKVSRDARMPQIVNIFVSEILINYQLFFPLGTRTPWNMM